MIVNKKSRAASPVGIQRSNREKPIQFDLPKEASYQLEDALKKETTPTSFDKQASLGNAFQIFGNVKKLILSKMGVSEQVAEEIASQVITKSEKIVMEYGISQDQVINDLIEELKTQSVGNQSILNGAFELHPFKHNTHNVEEYIKNRLTTEMMMSAGDAEHFKTVVYRNAQDLTVVLRPHKREEIAKALVDLIVENNDKTVIYNIKSSPTLLESLKAFL